LRDSNGVTDWKVPLGRKQHIYRFPGLMSARNFSQSSRLQDPAQDARIENIADEKYNLFKENKLWPQGISPKG